MNAPYGHAHALLSQCSRGCDRYAVVISDRDKSLICVVCAVREEREDASV